MKRVSSITETSLLVLRRPLALALLLGFCSVVMSPSSIAAPMTPIFGPKQYTRIAGRPQTFTETFQHPCGTAQCQIVVVNGNADGAKRISSASIFLNGKEIVGPSDFNQQVARIVRPVTLADQNQLTIRLASKPGSFLTVSVECLAPAAVLTVGEPGVSLFNSTTLLSALDLINTGTAAAENVTVKAITLPGGTLTSPTLPASLGTIPAGGSTVLNADFTGGPFIPESSYGLTVEGTYTVGGFTFCFTLNATLVIPPAAPGSAPLTFVTVESHQASGGPPFPHQPPTFDEHVNPAGPPVPTAPFVPGTPTATTTETQMATLAPVRAPLAPGPIVFAANTGLGLTPGTTSGTVATGDNAVEPSGASGGAVSFVAANWTAAFSTDGGTTFRQLDPTTIFPNDSIGFCCDQIVQYEPSIDRFIWLLQGPGGYRLAAASPANIIMFNADRRAWNYWNLTPQLFGQPQGTVLDYPDLSVGKKSLNISFDAGAGKGGCPRGCTQGFQVAEFSLAEIQAGGFIRLGYTDPKDGRLAWGAHLTQNPGDESFWAGHNGNTKLRVFFSVENSGTYSWRDIGISSWANDAPTSLTPDGKDWLAKNFNGPNGNTFPRNAIIGSTRVGNQLWFAWSAGKKIIGQSGAGSNFPQAHVEMVTLDRSKNFKKIQQVQIWNNNYAFAYPALATNALCLEVGLSFEFGGGGNYENHVVGFWGDFIAYITTGSNVGTTRFGDYVTIRQAPVTEANPGNLFTAFGYGLNSVSPPGAGTTTDVRYVLFGRPKEHCIIP